MSSEALAAWVGVALTLAISIWSLTIAKRAERAARDDRDEREAARVSGWVSFVYSKEDESDKRKWKNVLVIRNGAEAAIHQVEATATMNGNQEVTFNAKVCLPGESYAEWVPSFKRQHKNRAWTLLSSCEELLQSGHFFRPYTVADKWTLVSLAFTDALGKRWRFTPGSGISAV
ncbi:hypothetical protein DEJ28_06635 [Curtobacterium sp. MCPF17_002]|uniref:hypothetical protein n=1 Tax=Curtobacterium sp. MCPF17_002 TaxID=2175645 RepID=UPI000DA9D495|nr:hypothetical protein [Curtobacterium sp. MCPF17_002]WIB78766.1 hypothetical protein DEJ28_06635 [Curtobacterium sp. MCPF17_002]